MKTSNKLLIAFASAMVILPLLGMIYVSRVKYKVGRYEDVVEQKIDNYSTATKGMTSLAATAFESIAFVDAKQLSINIRYIKDEKFGVKITDHFKDLISMKVENGQLLISMKDGATEKRRQYINIYVYAPTLQEVQVNNADGAYILATVDSLKFNARDTRSASTNNGAHIGHLTMTATNVGEVNFREEDVKSLTLTLEKAFFRSQETSYENLYIQAKGGSEVEIRGNYDSKNKYQIKNLVLNTFGKNDLKLENIQVLNCSGKFSDETTVAMPAANINQMYKK